MKDYVSPTIQVFDLKETQNLILTSGETPDFILNDREWDYSVKE